MAKKKKKKQHGGKRKGAGRPRAVRSGINPHLHSRIRADLLERLEKGAAARGSTPRAVLEGLIEREFPEPATLARAQSSL